MSKESESKEHVEEALLINNIFVNTVSPVVQIIGNGTGTARKDTGGKWKVVIASGAQTKKPEWHSFYLVGVTNVPPEFPTLKMQLISVEGKFPYTFQEQ